MSSHNLRPRTKSTAEARPAGSSTSTQQRPVKKRKTAAPKNDEKSSFSRGSDAGEVRNPGLSPNHLSTQSARSSSKTSTTLTLSEYTGDIFAAPDNALLIHACNCEGSWGAGIALAFKKNYPESFKEYARHCKAYLHDDLRGTALLIPPFTTHSQRRHMVGCLFTSRSKGKKRDSAESILEATTPAMLDLIKQVEEWNSRAVDNEQSNCTVQRDTVRDVRMCKINSGLFGVPWEKTKTALEAIEVGGHGITKIEVITRPE